MHLLRILMAFCIVLSSVMPATAAPHGTLVLSGVEWRTSASEPVFKAKRTVATTTCPQSGGAHGALCGPDMMAEDDVTVPCAAVATCPGGSRLAVHDGVVPRPLPRPPQLG